MTVRRRDLPSTAPRAAERGSAASKLAWGFVIVLAIVHYDFWFWHDTTLVFGFMPIGLAFHALISVLAGVAWWLVAKYAWPSWVEEWADQGSDDR